MSYWDLAADVAHLITILKRQVLWTDRGIELEADPRHVDLILNEAGEGAKVTTPLVKGPVEEPASQQLLRVAARQVYDSHNMQIASSYCFEFRKLNTMF